MQILNGVIVKLWAFTLVLNSNGSQEYTDPVSTNLWCSIFTVKNNSNHVMILPDVARIKDQLLLYCNKDLSTTGENLIEYNGYFYLPIDYENNYLQCKSIGGRKYQLNHTNTTSIEMKKYGANFYQPKPVRQTKINFQPEIKSGMGRARDPSGLSKPPLSPIDSVNCKI